MLRQEGELARGGKDMNKAGMGEIDFGNDCLSGLKTQSFDKPGGNSNG